MRDTTDEDDLIRQNPDLFPKLNEELDWRDFMQAEANRVEHMKPKPWPEKKGAATGGGFKRLPRPFSKERDEVLEKLTDTPQLVEEMAGNVSSEKTRVRGHLNRLERDGLAKIAGKVSGGRKLWVKA